MFKDYKPGDKVKMVKDTKVSVKGSNGISVYKQGEKHIVDAVTMGMFSDYDIKLKHSISGCGYVLFEDIEPFTEFTLSDIKTGMLVKTGDGVLRLCIGNTLISINNGGLGLSLFEEDFTTKKMNAKHNIVKVYDEPNKNGEVDWFGADMSFWLGDEHFLNYSELLWEYTEPEVEPEPEPEPEVEELTISEIETRLGISNLKIVGEQ